MRLSPFALVDGLLAPAAEPRRLAFFTQAPFAHRGLHGPGAIENSRAAVDAAIAAGHGIEIDVRLSRDGIAFVFHDAGLERLTGQPGAIETLGSVQLEAIRLSGSDEALPRLTEIMARVAGRVPVLIEAKAPDANVAALCLGIRHAIEGYRGAVAVMSFNPEVPRWFVQHNPRVLRGLVVSEQGAGAIKGMFRRNFALLRAQPQFLAYDVRDLPSRFAARLRRHGLPVLTWTVRDAATEQAGRKWADQLIYERAGQPGR